MDEIDLWVKTITFILLVFASAFFSGSEVAIFGLSREDKEELNNRKQPSARKLQKLLDAPQKTLVTILTGNNLVNISAASIAALLASDFTKLYNIPNYIGIIFEVVVVTFILLILSEITPKMFALRNPMSIAIRVAPAIDMIRVLIFPAVWVFAAFTDFVARILGVAKIKLIYSTEELKTLVEISEEKGQLEESEREMISSIFTFGDTLVKEIMVPRMDVSMIGIDTPLQSLIDHINTSGFTRYPVFKGNQDEIAGFLYAKDLLRFIRDKEQTFNLEDILREPYFVPENKEIADLLKEFQKNKIHVAIVVDEYGGTAGLVTLEDILEEIVGEIQDEYDQETPLYTKISADEFDADAIMPIEKVNEMLGEKVLPDAGDYETLGGFIYDLTGKIPTENEFVDYGGYKFIVIEVEGQRLTKIRIERNSG